MELNFECPMCGQHISATPAQIGITTQCPNCNGAITVPNVSTLPPPVPPAPPVADLKPIPPESNRMELYVYNNEKQLGPFANAQVAEALRNGKFSYDDIAWREGWTDWRPLRTLFPPPPPGKTAGSITHGRGDVERLLWTGNPSHWLYAPAWTLAILLSPILIGLIFIPFIFLDRARRVYRVSATKVAIEYGIWIKSSNEIRICDIRSINITRSGLSGLAGVGNLEFSSAATDRAEVVFAAITEPEKVRQIVSKLQESAESPRLSLSKR